MVYLSSGALDWSPDPSDGFQIGRFSDDNEDFRLSGELPAFRESGEERSPVPGPHDLAWRIGAGRAVVSR